MLRAYPEGVFQRRDRTDCDNSTYVQLPLEDCDSGSGMCGILQRHMYGTPKAAAGWQSERSSKLVDMEFTQGGARPCIFFHSDWDILCSAHGDCFVAVCPFDAIDCYEEALEKVYELKKGGRIGPGPKHDKEATCLNRIIRWEPGGTRVRG